MAASEVVVSCTVLLKEVAFGASSVVLHPSAHPTTPGELFCVLIVEI